MVKRTDEKHDRESEFRYKGVRKRKWGKWVSEIRLPNSRERIWLGSYDTPEKAARAFDFATFCLRGRKAQFNFPDNPPDTAGGRLLNPAEIPAAAARFANEPPPEKDLNSEMQSSSSVSDGRIPPGFDPANEWLFSDCFGPPDLGTFQAFDDFPSATDGFAEAPPPPPPDVDGLADNATIGFPHDSFLWNF